MRNRFVRGLAFCVISLAATSVYGGLGYGVISVWPLDGDLNDIVGSNDGTLVGTDTTANFTNDGAFGQGITLDGVDQYVDVGNDSSLNVESQSGSVSISAWFRVGGFTKDWQALVAKGEGSAFRIARRANNNIMSYAGGSGDIPTADGIGPNVNDRGALHHLVAISENGVSTRLWVDGGLVATGDPPTIVNAGNDADPMANPSLFIGENPQALGRTWKGLIDDVGIWGRPLSESEVMTIYSSGKSLRVLIPEPSTFLLLGAGLGSLIALRRRR